MLSTIISFNQAIERIFQTIRLLNGVIEYLRLHKKFKMSADAFEENYKKSISESSTPSRDQSQLVHTPSHQHEQAENNDKPLSKDILNSSTTTASSSPLSNSNPSPMRVVGTPEHTEKQFTWMMHDLPKVYDC